MSRWAKRRGKRRQKELRDFEGRISSTTSRQQNLYLFDIVASLCAGFNEHDIQFLCSLLTLLRGDLSAQVEAEMGDGRTDRHGKKHRKEDRPEGEWRDGERNKESSTQNLVFWGWKKREVSLVITQTDREEDEGREAAVLSKDEAARETTHSLNSRTLIHLVNTWEELYIPEASGWPP